ncbi:hypothetical protein WN51_07488 [Melipona quadrifasciata]|uniref:Uncharacterized protein n=1 Tax=Melipona quadrifasciata TaxID=166423 RepID=A0A0M9A771_9HYME|nr:hypothetical protein WN51_07488 [Melipona quadrifasciata]
MANSEEDFTTLCRRNKEGGEGTGEQRISRAPHGGYASYTLEECEKSKKNKSLELRRIQHLKRSHVIDLPDAIIKQSWERLFTVKRNPDSKRKKKKEYEENVNIFAGSYRERISQEGARIGSFLTEVFYNHELNSNLNSGFKFTIHGEDKERRDGSKGKKESTEQKRNDLPPRGALEYTRLQHQEYFRGFKTGHGGLRPLEEKAMAETRRLGLNRWPPRLNDDTRQVHENRVDKLMNDFFLENGVSALLTSRLQIVIM